MSLDEMPAREILHATVTPSIAAIWLGNESETDNHNEVLKYMCLHREMFIFLQFSSFHFRAINLYSL